MRKILKWTAGLFLALAAVLAATGVYLHQSLPGPSAAPHKIEALPRDEIFVPVKPGHPLSYLCSGEEDGPCVIYVHGTPGSARDFADYLVEPYPGVFAVSVDRPGFGESGPDGAIPSLARQAAALYALVRDLDCPDPVLVGHSLGGSVVLRFAADHPEIPGAIVLLSTPADPALEKASWYQRAGASGAVNALLPRAAANACTEIAALSGELEKLAPRLARIRCPVVIVQGEDDRLVPGGHASFLYSRLTGSRAVTLTLIPDEGHFLPWDDREAVEVAVGQAFSLMGGAFDAGPPDQFRLARNGYGG